MEVGGYPWRRAGLAATAFPARHSPEAVWLRGEADGRVLDLHGDTADCEGLREACRDADPPWAGCTSMVEKDGHLTPADCAAVVAAALPRRVLLTHLGPGVETDLPRAADGAAVKL